MLIEQAQADMRHAYFGGATGIATSGIVWLAAAVTAYLVSARGAIAALFIGGMFIHPAAMLLSRLLGRPGAHTKGNPLAPLALEGTVWLMLATAVAFLASMQRTEFFFIAMLLTIGGRYFTFATLYGLKLYWVCGGTLAAAGFALSAFGADAAVIAMTGGMLELIFAAWIFMNSRLVPTPGVA
jgi:hypothetical protein